MHRRNGRVWRRLRVAVLTGVLALVFAAGAASVFAAAEPQSTAVGAQAQEQLTVEPDPVRWDLAVAIAAAISLPAIASGYAVARVGAAALGAASEKPELLTRSLIFVALGEGIAIYGLLMAILLWTRL